MDMNADIQFRDIFRFHQTGIGQRREVLGTFRPTGQPPTFLEEMKVRGMDVDERMFQL